MLRSHIRWRRPSKSGMLLKELKKFDPFMPDFEEVIRFQEVPPLTDRQIFLAFLKHWASPHGKHVPFVRSNDQAWTDYFENYDHVRIQARMDLMKKGQELLEQEAKDFASFSTDPSLVYINGSGWTTSTLNGVQFSVSGHYVLNKSVNMVTFNHLRFIINDYADADGGKDFLLSALRFAGEFPIANWQMFQWFPVTIEWDLQDPVVLSFPEMKDPIVTGGWPFER